MEGFLNGLRIRYPVQNLGVRDDRLDGIYSPGYADSKIGEHIHETFLGGADRYSAFCPIDRPHIDHWKVLIRSAIGKEISRPGLSVVDVGSGSGTTVFPLLELLVQSQVVATDLSLPMLLQMRNLARHNGYQSLTILQMNAEDMLFGDGQVNIVTGAHVLHHALSLESMFSEIRRVLAPDGIAAFWEPFEDGAQLLAGLFDVWMEMDPYQQEHFSTGTTEAMRGFTADLDRRKGRTKSPEVLATLDDKWYFTRQFIEDLAAKAGFSHCSLYNVYKPHNVIRLMADHELRRWGFGLSLVPEWALKKLETFQARFSDDYLTAHPFSASIVLRI